MIFLDHLIFIFQLKQLIFILGWYLTTSSIRLKRARRKKKGNVVSIPGPAFIHGNSEEKTFSDFFHEVKKNIKTAPGQQPQLIFCSDAEKGIRSAAEDIFTHGKLFFCTKHLKDNVKDDLKNCPPSVRNQILTQIFGRNQWGEDGLTSATDERDFIKRKTEIDSSAFPPGKFDQKMKKIWQNVKTRLECGDAVEPNITSNTVEAVNKNVKYYANFSLEKLPELIDLLSDMAYDAKLEFMQAFIGRGDIEILGSLGQRCAVRPDLWELKTLEQRENVFQTFVTGHKPRSTTVTSTLGDYTMDDPGGVRQKLNHRKRPTRQRTRAVRPTKGTKRKAPDNEGED